MQSWGQRQIKEVDFPFKKVDFPFIEEKKGGLSMHERRIFNA
jgi:hypothetical protein